MHTFIPELENQGQIKICVRDQPTLQSKFHGSQGYTKNPYVSIAVDLNELLFMLTSVLSGSYSLSASFSIDLHKGFDGDMLFMAECFKVSHGLYIICEYLFPSAIERSFSDDD